ncbi:MAG: hypothetical protein F6K47_31180 [Symploca sp. SIO2E6]|nr:hypothetical protein [Symploca sp. SIO2E6]
MVKNEFPIGQTLTAVSCFEYQRFDVKELCLDQVKLFFHNQIDERFKAHATHNATIKTEVVLSALALYLDCAEDVPLRENVAVIEDEVGGTGI